MSDDHALETTAPAAAPYRTHTHTPVSPGATYATGTSSSHLPRDQRLSSDSTQSGGSRAGHQSVMSTTSTSPGASAFLRTAATLEGLGRQLVDLKDEDNDIEVVCCCGSTGASSSTATCGMWKARDRMEDKLKLSGEIGDALLQRYEALERQHQREVEKFERQLEVKRTALAESLRRVNNLEKANNTHMAHYADISKKNEALEKRYTQALHTQTLTQQSLTHVRAELTSLRAKTQRQSIARFNSDEAEERFLDVEKRYDELRETHEVEVRNLKEEGRRRKRAEARVEELEGQLGAKCKEVEQVKQARAKDAQDLLGNAKERLAILHEELSETFRAESPGDAPEYQKALEDLVANNALLKHDASEISLLLNDSREEVRLLKEEIDELRSVVGAAGRTSPDVPSSRRLASELIRSHSHSRTESSPNVGATLDRGSWARMSVHIPASSRMWEHARKASLAPSFASTSTTGDGALQSPGLGMGPVGEYGGSLVSEGSAGYVTSPKEGRESPRPVFRSSPSGGIGYVLNGVPKSKTTMPRPPVRRSGSSDRPRPIRTYSPGVVESIAEWGDDAHTAGGTSPQVDEPMSPGSEYFRTMEASRKRRSILLSRSSTQGDGEYSPNASTTMVDQSIGDVTSPMTESDPMSPKDSHTTKRVHRRTLLLLTKSMGVQTDPVEITSVASQHGMIDQFTSADTSAITSPQPNMDGSETSSLHEARNQPGGGVLNALVEHLTKLLTKLRAADIPTLNKRLKKQHLPGDVSHLSRSTLRTLQTDVAELRTAFKGVLDVPIISRREFSLLLKLFKDVFGELIELQAVVNDVTIDPSLAKKLQKTAFKDEEADEARQKGGGLGWIANPITKFFVTPAQEVEPEPKQGDRAGMPRVDRGKLQAGTIKAPKLQASTSATNTHVSVEFGGAGIVRRATPAAPGAGPPVPGVSDVLPPSPDPTGAPSFAQAPAAISGSAASLAPPSSRSTGTLRPQKSRANRNELLGIFAGANPRSGPALPWPTSGTGISPIPNRQLRAASSQYFNDKTVRPRDQDTDHRKRLSTVVDAVIDRTADQIDEFDPNTAGSFEPPLLERTLRPRGLSDSSIRSTFISHGNEYDPMGGMGIAGQGRLSVAAYTPALGTSAGERKGYLESFASRFNPFRASPSDSAIDGTPTQDDTPTSPPVADSASLAKEVPSPARPIPASPHRGKSKSSAQPGVSVTASSPSSSALGQSVSHNQSLGQNQGILGMLASSITVAGVGEDEGEGLDGMEGRMRRGMGRVNSGQGGLR